MGNYRLYLLFGGHISHAVELTCENDMEAIAEAEAKPWPAEKELWERSRVVRVFPARPLDEKAPQHARAES